MKKDTIYIRLALLWPKVYRLVCCYCGGKASRGGNDIDGEYSHVKCHKEACEC